MRTKTFRLGIWGWWQGHNLGDNWIKNVMKRAFPFAECVPTNILKFRGYDFMICGGGGLFIYDVIRPWNKFWKIKVPFGIMGMGAEFPHESNLARRLEKKSRFFFVRDDYSIRCMKVSDATKSYDCTFIEPLMWNELEDMEPQKLFFVWRDGQELLDNQQFNDYIKYNVDVNDAWQELIRKNFTEIISDDFQTNEADIEERIAGCGFVISGRFHGIVAAIQKGIPFIAIDICPKIRVLVDDAGLSEYCIKISELDKAEQLIKKALSETDQIRKKEADYRKKAHKKMQQDVLTAYKEIYKSTKPIRILDCTINVESSEYLESQQKIREYATVKTLPIKAYSGKKDEETLSLKQMQKQIKAKKPHLVIVSTMKQLTDDVQQLLQADNIEVITLTELAANTSGKDDEGYVRFLTEFLKKE